MFALCREKARPAKPTVLHRALKKRGHAQKLAAASGESPFKRKFHFIFYVSLWVADGREASQPAF